MIGVLRNALVAAALIGASASCALEGAEAPLAVECDLLRDQLSAKLASRIEDSSTFLLENGDRVIRCFGESETIDSKALVARALLTRSRFHIERGGYVEAIAALDEIIRRYRDAKDENLASAVRIAFPMKAWALQQLKRYEDEINAHDEAISRYDSASAPADLAVLYDATIRKARALGNMKRGAESVVVLNSVIERLRDSRDPWLHERLVQAVAQKAVSLYDLGLFEESVRVNREVVAAFGAEGNPEVRRLVALALSNNGAHFRRIRNAAEFIKVNREIVTRFGAAEEPAVRRLVLAAHKNLVEVFDAKGQRRDADSAVKALASFARPGLAEERQAAAAALVQQAGWRSKEPGGAREAQALYERIISQFGDDRPLLPEVLTAIGEKASRLAERGQREDAARLWSDLVKLADDNGRRRDQAVLIALRNRGATYDLLGLKAEADASYADLLTRGGDASKPLVRAVVINALAERAKMQRSAAQELPFYDEIVRRFAAYDDADTRYAVAQALLNKGARLAQALQTEQALATFLTVETLYGSDTGVRMRDNLAPARLNLVHALLRLQRKQEALAAAARFLKLYPPGTVERAMIEDARQLFKEAGKS